jgi:hypothetical protein
MALFALAAAHLEVELLVLLLRLLPLFPLLIVTTLTTCIHLKFRSEAANRQFPTGSFQHPVFNNQFATRRQKRGAGAGQAGHDEVFNI